MPAYEQRSIEHFFSLHGVTSADQKARLLPALTPLIYAYNQHVIALEKEMDEYKKTQEERSIQEIEEQIAKAVGSDDGSAGYVMP